MLGFDVLSIKIVANTWFGFIWFFYFEQMMQAKFQKKKQFIIHLVFAFAAGSIAILMQRLPSFLSLPIGLILCFAGTMAFIAKRVYKIFVVLLLFCLTGVCELLSVVLSSRILHISEIQIRLIYENAHQYTMAMAIDMFFVTLVFLSVSILARHRAFKMDVKSVLEFICFPLSQLIMLNSLLQIILFGRSRDPVLLGTVFLVAASVADVALFFALRDISQKRDLEQQNYFLKQQEQVQMQHYEQLRGQYEDIRKLRHDIVNHLRTIQILTKRQHHEEASRYADDLVQRFEEIAARSLCENKIVDALLSSKRMQAKQAGVQMQINVTLPEEIAVCDTDLMCIFSNLIDNALAASMQIDAQEKRSVIIYSACRAENLIVQVENKKAIAGSTPVAPGDHMGLGQNIVRDVVAHYGGSCEFQDQNTLYTARVLVPIGKTE